MYFNYSYENRIHIYCQPCIYIFDMLSVAVNCDVVNQKMEICYTPHADVSSDTPVKMYITEKYNKPECMGTKVTTVADPAPADACPVGSYNLILNLPATSKADNCETAIVTGVSSDIPLIIHITFYLCI